jgi:hypothetical protein
MSLKGYQVIIPNRLSKIMSDLLKPIMKEHILEKYHRHLRMQFRLLRNAVTCTRLGLRKSASFIYVMSWFDTCCLWDRLVRSHT